jgi:hypothetical protein
MTVLQESGFKWSSVNIWRYLEFELKERVVEVCRHFVGSIGNLNSPLCWERCGFTKELMKLETLHFMCNDIFGGYVKSGGNAP